MGKIEVGARVNIRRSSEQRDRRSRKSRDVPPQDVTLKIPAEDAKKLQEYAEKIYARHKYIISNEITALKVALEADGKTKTRATQKITERIRDDQIAIEKAERDERQLDHWRAAREELRQLRPSKSILDSLEVVFLDSLIRTLQHLENFNETQAELSELRVKCEDMRKELRRVEHQISETQKALQEQDDRIRRRAWRSFKHGHQFLAKFEGE